MTKTRLNAKKIIVLPIFLCYCFIANAILDLDFSQKRGYYNNTFQLIIECDDPSATIRYTTDTSKPSTNNGTIYNEPILINNTTLLRAYAYSNNDESNVRTHSYIFINDVTNQSNLYSYIVDDPVYAPQMENSLRALPVISLVSSNINTGFINDEVETSVEMFFPDNSRSGFMVHSGIQTWGGSPTNPKKHYRLEFKSLYGTPMLAYKIFKSDNYDNTEYKIPPAEKFNKLLLRSGSQDGLNAEYGHESRAQYVRNRVLFDIQMEMGYPAAHGRYVHVFLNGNYNGQYHLMERPDAEFFASYYGGDELDYEVYKSGDIWDGPYTLYDSNYWSLSNNINLSSANAIANTNRYLDLDNASAYLLLMSYASGFDWADDHNCLAGGNLTPGLGGYKFVLWDVDFAIGNGGIWHPTYASRTSYFNAPVNQQGPIPNGLINSVEFKYMMADHMECACYNNGLLTPAKVDEMYMHRINQVTTSLIAESARWGNYPFIFKNEIGESKHISDHNWDVNNEFTNELNRMRNDYFPNRTNSMVNHYIDKGLTSDLNAVQFNQYGGIANQGLTLQLTNTNPQSKIYYTIDGSDPRAVGGGISNTAILYNGSITLPNGVITINARVRDDNHGNSNINKWSAKCPRTFYVQQNYSDIVINEIHYNPTDSIFFNNFTNMMDTVSGKSFEFIELKNIGNDAVYLKDVNFTKGISIQFDENALISANDFYVLAEDAFWFEEKYGFTPDATYTGKLDNGGENIWLVDPAGNFIDSLSYDDRLPWDTIPDSGKYSLALVNGALDNSVAANWKTQINYTSPNAENNFCAPITNNISKADVTCYGEADGFAVANLTGGTAPFTYLWNNGQTTSTITDLTVGDYAVTIFDANQCQQTNSISITQPTQLLASSSSNHETAYQANDGSASVNVSGGTPPYAYSWSTGATVSSLINLAPGNYNVTITDALNCDITENIVINAFDCSAFTVNVSKANESYYQGNDGSATVQISGGGSPYTYNWSNGATTSSINNLNPGIYSVTITNAAGCPLTESISIVPYVCKGVVANVTQKDESCFNKSDGSLAIKNIQNGTAPYAINWSNGATRTLINNLTQGTYTVQITDNFKCPFSETFTINSPNPLVINKTITNASTSNIADGAIDLSVTGGTQPYSFYWSNSQLTEDATNLLPSNYWVSVTDVNNCNVIENNIQVGVSGSSCILSLSQTNQPKIGNGVVQVQDYITSNGSVNNGVSASFKAGDYVELRNHFEVQSGAGFEAAIDSCN